MLAHGALLRLAPGMIVAAELRVAVRPDRHPLAVLLPQQMPGDAILTQFHMDSGPVRILKGTRTTVRLRIQQTGKTGLSHLLRQRPGDPEGFKAFKHFLDCAGADISTLAYLA